MSTATSSGTMTAPARITRPARSVRQTAVYYVLLTFGPLSDKELVARYDALRRYVGAQFADLDQSPSGLRSRRAELTRMGYVEPAMKNGKVQRTDGRLWKAI
jgi:hypothetical protein